jgi:hypothetical protein
MNKQEQHRIAQHESIHGILALSCSTVHQVRCYPVGQTEVSFPFTPSSLYLFYRKHPEETHRQMIKVLGVIIGPHVIQGAPLEGSDDVADWQAAYNRLQNASMHWRTVLDQARAYVHTWYRVEGRAALVERVAQELTKRVAVHGDKRWRALVQSCQPVRQAPRSTGSIDLNRLRPEVLECLMDWFDWRSVGHGRAGFVLQSW